MRFPMSHSRPARSRPSPPRAGKSSRSRKSRPRASRAAIKLTLHTGPKGLQADGSDVALVDFEVVDAQGRRCPTDEARVDFDITGPAIWRGGFNAAKTQYDQQPLSRHRVRHQPRGHPLDSHSGHDHADGQARRVSSRPPIEIKSAPVEITAGLSTEMPPQLPGPVAQISATR